MTHDRRDAWDDPANDSRLWRWVIAAALGIPAALVISERFPLRQTEQGQFWGWLIAMLVALSVVWLLATLVERWWQRRRERRYEADRRNRR
jgi:4-amino-4-deoxy-L-arabinose transferase-like glycosyltransferase